MSRQFTKLICCLASVLFAAAAARCLLPPQAARGDDVTVAPTSPASNALDITAQTADSHDGIGLFPHDRQFTVDVPHGDGDGTHWVEQVVDTDFGGACMRRTWTATATWTCSARQSLRMTSRSG